jgi:hypothetical protein
MNILGFTQISFVWISFKGNLQKILCSWNLNLKGKKHANEFGSY